MKDKNCDIGRAAEGKLGNALGALPTSGSAYHFQVKDFPPITLDVPSAEKTDEEKRDDKKTADEVKAGVR